MSLTEPKKKPRLLVIAGPNGSGKSTVTKGLPLIGLYVNADEIKRVSRCTDLEAAQEAGYEICVVFVLTSDAEINVRRVQERAAAGGHDVPEDKIRSRYTKSLQNLSPLVRIADKTRVLDNSGAEPRLICEVEGNAVRIWDNDVWTKSAILRLLEKRD